jgi:Arc/MetJ-type ribon-helix-helix transcriptional regulator
MRSTNYRLPESLIDRLKRESKRSGLSMSEIVRHAIIDFLDNRKHIRIREERLEYNAKETSSEEPGV